MDDLFGAILEEKKSFLTTLYIFSVAFVLSSSLIYYAEHKVQPEAFRSIPDAMYWSIITLTTVGYGDVSPITVFGKVIEGMEFVDKIKRGDENNNGSVTDPDKIISFKSL